MRRQRLVGLLLLALLASGCWDRLEPDRAASVIALGLDRGHEQPLRVTAQVSIPRLLTGGGREGGGGGGQQPPFANQVAEARGVSEGLRILGQHSPRIFHLGHLQVVVVSEDVARAGVAPLLDHLTSDREVRRVVHLAVSSSPARDVLEVRTRLENLSGVSIAEELRDLPETTGLPESTIVRFMNAIHDEGVEPILPVVHRVDAAGRIMERPPGAREEAAGQAAQAASGSVPGPGPGGPAPSRSPGGSASGQGPGGGGAEVPVAVRVAGVAVFKDDRLVGTLNDLEARGLAWLMGRLQRGIVVVPAPLAGPGPAVLYVRRVQAKLEPQLRTGPAMKVRLEVRADVLEMLAPTYDLTPEEMDRLEQAAARAIADEIMATMRRVQKEFRSDVYGFGWTFYRRYPQVWRRDLGPRWDQVFPDLPVQLEVKVNLITPFFAWRSPLGPSR